MKLFISFICVQLLGFHLTGQEQFTFDHNGVEREYLLHLPDNLSPSAPLVFVLHGYTSSASNISVYSGMTRQADLHGFAVCYPQGTEDFRGTTHWNANLSISDTDDIGFLSELSSFLHEEYNLSADNTFSCGMSNGGFMSYTLACERPDVFKAIASVTGTMSGYDWNNCNPDKPVPVFQISGVDDNVVPYDGNWNPGGGWGGGPGAEGVNEFWTTTNQTDILETTEISSNLNAQYYTSSDEDNNNQVWFYPIENWGHDWPGAWNQSRSGILAAEEIWEFFSLFINQETTSTGKTPSQVISIYPNPSSMYIHVSGIDEEEITIADMSYQVVMKSKPIQSEVNISSLSQGVYILKAKNQFFKFVKL